MMTESPNYHTSIGGTWFKIGKIGKIGIVEPKSLDVVLCTSMPCPTYSKASLSIPKLRRGPFFFFYCHGHSACQLLYNYRLAFFLSSVAKAISLFHNSTQQPALIKHLIHNRPSRGDHLVFLYMSFILKSKQLGYSYLYLNAYHMLPFQSPNSFIRFPGKPFFIIICFPK